MIGTQRNRALFQKTSINLRNLLVIATPYHHNVIHGTATHGSTLQQGDP